MQRQSNSEIIAWVNDELTLAMLELLTCRNLNKSKWTRKISMLHSIRNELTQTNA